MGGQTLGDLVGICDGRAQGGLGRVVQGPVDGPMRTLGWVLHETQLDRLGWELQTDRGLVTPEGIVAHESAQQRQPGVGALSIPDGL